MSTKLPSSGITVKANRAWRQFKYRYEVPARLFYKGGQFDHMGAEGVAEEYEDGFFKYKGHWYHLSDFTNASAAFEGWDGVAPDSFFSGILIKISKDGERYKVGTYYS